MLARAKRFLSGTFTTLTLGTLLGFAGCDGCSDERSGRNPECPPGTATCPCGPMNACDEGLSFEDSICRGVVTRTVSISDERSRSCEVLVSETAGGHLLRATFEDSLRGTFVAERPRVAVSFTATADEPILGSAIGLVQAEGAGNIEITKSACFDVKGSALAGATVSLNAP
jgi:hypothetical protein